MNLPLNQLACTGVGQTEPLTAFIRRIQRDVENGRLSELARTLDRFETHVLSRRNTISRMRRAAERYVLRPLKRWVLSALAGHENARYSRLFLSHPQVRDRFCRYFRFSLNDIARLSRDHGIDIPQPSDVVCGHAHQPIPWGARELVDEIDGRTVQFCNTGGWVSSRCAAAISWSRSNWFQRLIIRAAPSERRPIQPGSSASRDRGVASYRRSAEPHRSPPAV